jgi:thioredoxin reductase
MKKAQIFITLALLTMLVAVNQYSKDPSKSFFGGLPWWGWTAIGLFLLVMGLTFALRDSRRARRLLENPLTEKEGTRKEELITEEQRRMYDPYGPDYPHPVIIKDRCIGCHACVDACPHDVLAIVNNISQPIAPDQCMEDTSCQVECPVNPKACIVVNTNKKIKPRPAPNRDASFMTNVSGCYIIGDVSGTPLIKNAANEGSQVAIHIAHEIHHSNGNQPQVDYDMAIVGAGPAGLSAALMAKRIGLRYIGIEQDTVMSTIVKYPKGKYVFLKPETMDWVGGIRLPGLEEYVEEVLEEFSGDSERGRIKELLAAERTGTLDESGAKLLATVRDQYQEMLEAELMRKVLETSADGDSDLAARQLLGDARKRFEEKGSSLEEWLRSMLSSDSASRLERARQRFEALLDSEDKHQLSKLLEEEKSGVIKPDEVGKLDRLNLARQLYGDDVETIINSRKLDDARYAALAEARSKVAGDQREVLLNTWILNMKENAVVINENESCKAIKKAEGGDYFTVETEKGREKQKMTYSARRVVLAIGNSGTPMKLKVPGEEMKVTRDAKTEDKVKYKLTDPEEYKRKKVIVVGAGNSAIEAAVDMVARRQGDKISFRSDDEINEVTLVIRSDLKNDLKFGNKQQVYDCIDEGKIKAYFGTAIKEIRDDEVVLMNARTQEPKATVPNDYIFALIGGDKPTGFLQSIGIKIG